MNDKFLINTITAWDEPPRARHQVANALAEKHQVVFVARNKTGSKRIDIVHVHERLTVINPVYPIDYRLRYRIPIINELYQKWLFKRLKQDYNKHLVINFDFTAHRIFTFFDTVVYYCNDEFIGNSKYPNWFNDTYFKLCEQKVIKKSFFCVATSPYLKDKLSRLNPGTYEIPLGVGLVQRDAVYQKISSKDKIIVCTLGIINERSISVELINAIIREDMFRLVMIGTIEHSLIKKLQNPEKVIIKGVLKGRELMEALSKIDIGLALYNISRINPGGSPNKLWQYLAAGKPVVVSYLPNINIHAFPPDSVYLYHENDVLIDLIMQAAHDDSEELFKQRIDFALENTWEKRIELFLEILEENIHKK